MVRNIKREMGRRRKRKMFMACRRETLKNASNCDETNKSKNRKHKISEKVVSL